MRITFSCSPEVDEGLGASGEGIMHWLGTNKGTTKYANPYISGAVDISRCLHHGSDWPISEKDKELMVQYRPNPEGEKSIWRDTYEDFDVIFTNVFGAMMGCSSQRYMCDGPLYFHLSNGVSVCPTHYSIRNSGCFGMAGDWNLEASVDGKAWDVLHESRGRGPLYDGIRRPERLRLWDIVKEYKGNDRKDAVCDHMERNQRHTWKIDNTSGKFYTHFRFLSVAIHDRGRNDCLHCIGFEVYGNVHEDWNYKKVEEAEEEEEGEEEEEEEEETETDEDRIQRLEVQNEALLNQNEKQQAQIVALSSENDSLKARVRQLENKRSAEEAGLPEH